MVKNTFLFIFLLLCSCTETATQKVPAHSTETVPSAKDTVSQLPAQADWKGHLSYSVLKERPNNALNNDSLKKIIDNHPEQNIDSLTDFILEMTKRQLTFSFGKCSSNPHELVKSKKANCVGYAAFFNSLMQYALEKNNLAEEYTCHHFVGKIFYNGTNVNALFDNDPFFKDHDFNLIYKFDQSYEIAVDPSLYEYLGIRRVAIKNKF